MKKTFFTASLVLLIATNCFSQTLEKKDYLQKSKNQKITAWVLLGTGVVVSVLGFTQIRLDGDYDYTVNNTQGEVLLATGMVVGITSFVFSVASKKNKIKAMNITIDAQQFRQLKSNNLYTVHYPALTMRIRL